LIAEREFVDGVLDATDFVLGEALGKSLGEVRVMPNAEIVEWLAFFAYRRAMQEVERV
jgi:hypothetical protein